MSKTVVILGGSYAGIKVAHQLLKSTLPLLKGLKVVLVNPGTHAYFNLATPRAIVPGLIPDDKLFAPIAPAFAKYSSTNFEFVLGKATLVSPDSKKVEVETESGSRELTYDVLVVTTGSSTISAVPWKQAGSYDETLKLLHSTQEQVKAAKSIAVGGAGVTGVETAGELGFEYGKTKEITLIAKDSVILSNFLGPKVGVNAQKELEARNVKTVFNTTVTSSNVLPSGATELTLSTGDTKTVDLYLPCLGLTANTSFMPSSLLNARGELIVDPYMAVKGVSDIYSCGDAADIEANKFMYAAEQAGHLARVLQAVLTGAEAKRVAYKPNPKPMGAVTVGRAKGFGQMGSWSLPSFMVMLVKGKTMMVENLPKVVNGTT